MANMGCYCKAYYAEKLSEFPDWNPNLQQLRPETNDADGEEVISPRTELRADDILYLQENYVVTDGIFLDQNVVFDAITPEWREFCSKVLDFEVPAECLAAAVGRQEGA